MQNKNNIALKTLVLINSDRKHAIKSAPVASIKRETKNSNVVSITSYLNRVAFFGGFAS
jgi:hypothetical protein